MKLLLEDAVKLIGQVAREMPLITGLKPIFKELGAPFTDEVSNFYLQITSDLLSEPYELSDGDIVKGEIWELIDRGLIRNDYKDMPVTLILRKTIGFDSLYISKKEWQANFRDRGLVRPTYQLNLTLREAVTKVQKKIIKLYPETAVE